MKAEELTFETIDVAEKEITKKTGGIGLILVILMFVAGTVMIVLGAAGATSVAFAVAGAGLLVLACILAPGLKVINPNEALVLTLFGKYYGTIKAPGFYMVNPFAVARNPVAEANASAVSEDGLELFGDNKKGEKKKAKNRSKKVSTKIITLNNGKQKVNDVMGNPIIIGAIVVWKVENPTKAVFNVDDYFQYLSTQCDAIIRATARAYPYDDMGEEDSDNEMTAEKTLRGSSQEIADTMKEQLQVRVENAGIKVLEVRLTHLAYAEEIAAAMLQRQQASAVIAARQKIVNGAVGMVKNAMDQLGEEDIIILDEERKAAMISNLLVVLCGHKDAQPIINSGTIY